MVGAKQVTDNSDAKKKKAAVSTLLLQWGVAYVCLSHSETAFSETIGNQWNGVAAEMLQVNLATF